LSIEDNKYYLVAILIIDIYTLRHISGELI